MPARRRKSRTAPWAWTTGKGGKRVRKRVAAGKTATSPTSASSASSPPNTPGEEHVDWKLLDETWQKERTSLVQAWVNLREAQILELTGKIEQAGGDLATLAIVEASPVGDALIAAAMRRLARFGVLSVTQEAAAQGVDLPGPDLAEVDAALAERADAVSVLLSRAISEVAGRRAIERTGSEALKPPEVAKEVADHLRGLSNAYLEEQLGGALTAGMNSGRRSAMGGAPPGSRYFGSALLDANVCQPCKHDDGREFKSLVAAEVQYPVGGNKACKGGVRCRCTIVLVGPESAPSVA